MFSTFFYAGQKVERDDLVSAFTKLMVNGDEDYDSECSLDIAMQGLATAIEALYPARNKQTKELTGTVKGSEAETLFFKHWLIANVKTLTARGFQPNNPLGEGKININDEAQVNAYREAGNSPDWSNPVASGEIEMPRWLVIHAAKVQGEIDAAREADFYRYAREQEAKKGSDETRDPETKGDPA